MNHRKRFSPEVYIQGILSQDRILLSRAITLVESSLESDKVLADQVVEGILPHTGNSIRVGITGVPGVGKSTFIESFGALLVEKGHRLAVLAIDPSSQQNKGSILGDKTRMETLARDPRAYIRPSPAGTALGGVSAKTREAMLLCEAAGFDVIIIETVGVGQSEIAVKGMVDFFLLLMLAGAGDELQGIKKGIVEICDALVINKADGAMTEVANRAKREYANALHLFPAKESGWFPKVKVCSGLTASGLPDIWEMIEEYQQKTKVNGFFMSNRSQQRVNWMHEHIRFLLETSFYENDAVKSAISEVENGVKEGSISSIGKAKQLVEMFYKLKST